MHCIEPSGYKEAEKLKGMQNWKNKDMLGQFVQDTEPASDKEKSWGWLRNGDLKKETEGMILPGTGFEDQLLEVQDRSQLCFTKM